MVLEIKNIYYIILFFLIIGSVFDITNSKIKKQVFLFNFIVIFLFATLRYGVGSDYFQYEALYQEALPLTKLKLKELLSNTHNLELGYLILQSLIKEFTISYRIFLIIYNLILFYFLYKGIIYNKNRNIQLLIFYSLFYLFYITSTYRQGMAIVILYYNLQNLELNNKKKFILYVIFAGMFHRISFIYLLFYPILQKKIKKRVYIFLFIICFILGYIDFLEKVLNILNLRLNTFSFFRRVYYYYTVKNNGKIGVSLLGYLQKIILIFFMSFNLNRNKIIYNNLFFYYIISFILFSNVGVLAGRISAVFAIVQVYYFSNSIYYLKKWEKVILIFVLIVFCCMYFIKELYTINPIRNEYNYLPYKILIF